MQNDPLGRALRELPRPEVSADFNERLLARLRDEEAPFPRRPRLGWLAAAAVAAGVLGVASWLALGESGPARTETPAATPQEAQIEALREEQRRLTEELESLRALAHRPAPVLWLDSDDRVDLVVDLGDLARRRPGSGARGGTQPASYRGQ